MNQIDVIAYHISVVMVFLAELTVVWVKRKELRWPS